MLVEIRNKAHGKDMNFAVMVVDLFDAAALKGKLDLNQMELCHSRFER